MYDIPEGKRATKGKSIANFLSIQEGEKITSVLALPKDVKKSPFSALLITRCGVVKKVPGDSFTDVRRSGIIAMKLAKGDELFKALKVDKGDSAILVSQDGQSIRFLESDARHMGRSARGIRGMRIKKDDMLVGADVIKKDADKNVSLLVVSEKGYGKKTKEKEYKKQKRGGSGIKTAKVTTKTGRLITASVITESTKELIAISKKGTAIRLALSDVPTLGRQTQGVRIMKLREDDKLASITCI
jgi:DNA gyrase subunit A